MRVAFIGAQKPMTLLMTWRGMEKKACLRL